MSRRLRVGVIGRTNKGNYGHGLDTVWKQIPETEVVSVADDDDAGRAKAQQVTRAATSYADYREMLAQEKLDLVAVSPRWIDQHRDMLVAAAEHGCHIFTEKPFCRTPAEADEVVRACEMRHVKLAIAFQTHYSPTLAVLKDLIQAGEIGEVLEVRGRGKEDHRGGGEDLWVLGSHVMDLMRYISGDPVDCYATVFAKGKPVTRSDVAAGNEGIGPLAGDHVQAAYRFANGVTGFFASRRNQGMDPWRFGVQVFGSKGIVDIAFGYPASCFLLRDPGWCPGRAPSSKWLPVTSSGLDKPEKISISGVDAGNVALVKDLVQSINEERQPLCNMYDARWTVEMISAVFESHRLGQPVKFPLNQRANPLTLLTT